ncbi:hypothetical protein DB30_05091 [Enhygromyxa salina]|uniref:STAS domain-containing protein n=1 Tax=Enhygromyxa salina TaxID=215803 RepID=A0A0C2D298_9BACT|nr:hypothetical protein DB30_05091 [Enhygromyxa salina]
MSAPIRARPLARRTQMMARGPGWRLVEGEADSWHVALRREVDDPVRTWAHLLRTIRSIATTHRLRPILIDLRDAQRLSGAAAQAAGLLLAEFEQRGLRICTIVGPDLIHAARLQHLISFHAPTCGGSFLTEDDGIEWIRTGPPPVAAPLRPRHGGLSVAPPRV